MEMQPLALSEILSLEGVLSIRNTVDGEWVSRYCQLSECQLLIYADESMEEIIQTIVITGETTVEEDDGPNSLFFHINEGGTFILGCGASSPEEARRWMEIVKTVTTPPPSLTMDDFNIVRVIGRGFFGKVMLVERKDTKELYAIKSVQKAKLLESGRPQTIVAERNIMMLVKNPFIIQLHFAFQTATKFYLGLEYAPGGELFYHMQQTGLIPVDDARLYVAEIAVALEHLHRFGIVYRDLKPENILFDAEGHVKLTDFGLAKDLCDTENTSTKTFCGTNHYLAPEIVTGKPYSYEIDWWALGVLLCEMLTGVTPFDGETRNKMFESIVNDEPTIPFGIDEDAAALIAWMLTKDPAKRPGFEEITSHPFFECLNWEYVVDRRYQPNFVPEVAETPETRAKRYFAKEFTEEAAVDSQVEFLPGDDALNIAGFSFNAPFVPDAQNQDDVYIDPDLMKEYEEMAKNAET